MERNLNDGAKPEADLVDELGSLSVLRPGRVPRMPRAFVTGGSGFIGGHLVEALLARGWQVRCLVRSQRSGETLQTLGAEVVVGQLHDVPQLTAWLSDVDHVFHVAGIILARRADDFQRINAEGVANIAAACAAQSNPPTLIYISSIAAAGPATRGGEVHEADQPHPISKYGLSKLEGEVLVQHFADRVPITILRPGVVFGPRDRLSLSIFQSIKTSGLHVYPRFRTPPLTVIYVHDLVNLTLEALAHGERLPSNDAPQLPGHGIYFAGRREHPTYHEFGWLAAQALGRRWFLPLPLTPPLPFIVGSCSELLSRLRGVPSIVNLDKMREATVTSWACSPAKAERDLHFAPSATLLDQMRETVAWYRAQRWL
jgi:nucleoside-diphosphate-sugar epimerase